MLAMLRLAAMIVSVVWIMVALAFALLIALLSANPFFLSPANWALILSPALPLSLFYFLDRRARE